MSTLILYCDGGSRGNPGDAGIGVMGLDCSDGKRTCILELSKYLPHKSNNHAEYMAVITALEYAISTNYTDIILRSDSKLIVEQLKGSWRVKNNDLQKLYRQAFALIGTLQNRGAKIDIQWIPRAQNQHADTLANLAMDRKAEPAPHPLQSEFREKVNAWEAAMFRHQQWVNEWVNFRLGFDTPDWKKDLGDTWVAVVEAWKALKL